MGVCEACGADAPDGSRFCPTCGVPLLKCTTCGFVNRAGDRFCAHCGRVFDTSAAGAGVELTKPVPTGSALAQLGPLLAGAAVLLVAAIIVALVGLGSLRRSGDIP